MEDCDLMEYRKQKTIEKKNRRDELRDKVRKLHDEGKKCSEIAKELGIAQSSVRAIIH